MVKQNGYYKVGKNQVVMVAVFDGVRNLTPQEKGVFGKKGVLVIF